MPKQLENLPERELFTHTYYLAVVCDDVVLVERMRKGRGVSDDEWIRYPVVLSLITSPSPRDLSTSRMPSSA